MMKKECSCCGLEIKKTSRTLPSCKCGALLCWKCAGKKCKDCTIITEERQLVRNYFADKYLSKVKPVITTMMFLLPLMLIFILASSDVSATWYSSDWNYRKEIQVFNDSRITANTSFPLKIILNSSNINYGLTNDTGQDIRCVNRADTTSLDIYVEKWNETGNSIIYCNVTVQNTSNTTLFLYYGNDAATSTSNFNATFGSNTRGAWGFNDEAGGFLDDFSDNNHNFELNQGAVYTRNESDIIPRKYGSVWLDGTNDYLLASADVDDTTTTQFSVSMWFRPDADKDGVYLMNTRDVGNAGFAMIYSSTHITYGSAINFYVPTTTVDFYSNGYDATDWNHVVVRFNSDLTIAEQWLNGNNLTVQSGDNRPDANYTPSSKNLCIGLYCNAPSTYFDGFIDEPRYYDTFISVNTIKLLYAQPVYSFGSEERDIISTSVSSGFYDETLNEVTSVDSGDEFMLWVNYSYDTNSTPVYSGGWCNYSGEYLLKEYYNTSVNTSIYGSLNVTYEMTGLEINEVNNDIVRLKLCRVSGLKNAIWATNCTGVSPVTIESGEMPLCSNGYLDYGLNITDCNGFSSVNLSVWSTATTPSNAIRVVDGRMGLDRSINVTSNNMTWNSSFNRFLSDEYESYGYGSISLDYDCQTNISGVDNQTGNTAVLGINNTAPRVVVDEVWYWLLSSPTPFVSGGSYKYPLENTFNISGKCLDSPGETLEVQIDLKYDNASVINTVNFTSPLPSSINYIQSNFSTEINYLSGLLDYTISVTCCDDGNLCDSSSDTFSAENSVPVASWINSSGSISNIPSVYNWTCVDPELSTTTPYLFVNGTLNTTIGSTGFWFNYPEGSYELNISCADSFRNSTSHDSIVVVFSQACMPQIFGLQDNGRYRNNSVLLSANCSNGIVLTECNLFVNKYVGETFNCSGDRVILEVGRQDFIVQVSDGLNPVNVSYVMYAKKVNDSGMGAYLTVIFLVVALGLLMIVYNRYLKLGALAVLIGLGGFVLGTYLLAFSYWAAGLVMVGSLMFVLYEVIK